MEHLVSTTEAARVLGVQKQTLAVWRLRGRGPRYVRFGGHRGRVVYDVGDLEEWISARKYESTSQEARARVDKGDNS